MKKLILLSFLILLICPNVNAFTFITNNSFHSNFWGTLWWESNFVQTGTRHWPEEQGHIYAQFTLNESDRWPGQYGSCSVGPDFGIGTVGEGTFTAIIDTTQKNLLGLVTEPDNGSNFWSNGISVRFFVPIDSANTGGNMDSYIMTSLNGFYGGPIYSLTAPTVVQVNLTRAIMYEHMIVCIKQSIYNSTVNPHAILDIVNPRTYGGPIVYNGSYFSKNSLGGRMIRTNTSSININTVALIDIGYTPTTTTSTTTTSTTTTTTIPGFCPVSNLTLTAPCMSAHGCCTQGDMINIGANVSGGSNCTGANTLQFDASGGTGCGIEFTGGDLSGITATFNYGGATHLGGQWGIPAVPPACAGKVVTPTFGSLWSGNPGTSTKMSQSPSPAPAGTFTICINAPTSTTLPGSTSTTLPLSGQLKITVVDKDSGLPITGAAVEATIVNPAGSPSNHITDILGQFIMYIYNCNSNIHMVATKVGYVTYDGVVSIGQGANTEEIDMVKAPSGNVNLLCNPATSIGDISSGIYEVCTFNNIANIESLNYDTVDFSYKIYSNYVPDHILDLPGTPSTFSDNVYIHELAVNSSYSGRLTAKFARKDGLKCTNYIAGYPLNIGHVSFYPQPPISNNVWIYDSNTPNIVYACLGSVNQANPGIIINIKDANYNGGSVSPSSDGDSFNRAECYTDAECSISGFGGGTCINNTCSVYPKFLTGYPKSIITQDSNGKNIQAVSLKWSIPVVCKPGTGTGGVACKQYNAFDYNFDVYRDSVDSLQSNKIMVTSVPSTTEFIDELDNLNQSQLVGKNAYYKVCARLWNSNSNVIFCTNEVNVSLVGCDPTAVDNSRVCAAGQECVAATFMCGANTNCANTNCNRLQDCVDAGCSRDTYACVLPPGGGSQKKCLPLANKCNYYKAPTVACANTTIQYCGDQSNTMSWLLQNTGGTGSYSSTNYTVSVESNSWCANKISDVVTPCYDSNQCASGYTCQGYYVMNNAVIQTCTFKDTIGSSLSIDRCFDGSSNLVGYCYPDNKCRISGGGRCVSGGGGTSCDPLFSEPNPACLSTQFCSSSAHICIDKEANGGYCNNDFQCTSGICNPTTQQCAGALGVCDYSICKDRTNKGYGCGCPSPKLCVPVNWNNPSTWNNGKCIDPLPLNAVCGSTNSLGVPLSQLQGSINADWLCASQNCLGDNFVDSTGVLSGTCKPVTTFCDANTLTTSNALDPEHYCHCSYSSIGDTYPCANIDVTNRDAAVAEVANNPSWCYMQTLSTSKPNGITAPDYRCYKKLSDTSTCDYNYECISGKCTGGVCISSGGGGLLGATCIISNLYSQTTAVWNKLSKNPETGVVKFWDDNCGTDPTAGPLYCEPCDYTTGLGYDVPTSYCTALTVTHGTTGRCRPVHNVGDWCYSSSQCSPTRVNIGGTYQNLYCGIDSSNPTNCSQSTDPTKNNWYCFTGNPDTFNKHCIAQTVSGCIHDSQTPFNQFTTYQDDTCYTMSKLGQAGVNTFCDDKYMCTTGSVSAKCQTLSDTLRATATVVPGNCVTQRCTVAADKKPYFSSECWRDPAFSDTTHNVAPATVQLVYCSSDGFCKWRKQAGDTCVDNKECDPQYVCLSSGICGTQTGCKVDADCLLPETHKCVNGQCVFKGTEEFSVSAVNNLTKPMGSPNTDTYDFVVNCKDHDTFFKATGTHSMSVKYCIGSCASGTEKYLGDSQDVVAPTVTGDLFNDLCSEDLKANRQKNKIISVTFYPIIGGQQSTNTLIKNIMVLARPLSVQMTRCSADSIDPLCSGYADPTLVYVIKSNNTITNSGIQTFEQRRIKCDSSAQAGIEYLIPIYPRTDLLSFNAYTFAIIKDWKTEKYYKCVDEYGSVKIGSTLVNPAEYIFGLKFTRAQQVFLLLVIVIGIPTLVLIGSKVGRR